MKPSAFDLVRPATLADASRILSESNGGARLVAGCQSLGPMLNLRLATPHTLIDLTSIPELTQIVDDSESVTIGACVTTAFIEDGRLPGRGIDPLAHIARNIAYRAVRNRSTIGGSLCHADPAADWVSTLCVFDAECLVYGNGKQRKIAADQFITGAYENALTAGDILQAIRIPRLSESARCGYYKVCRKAGEFASALAAVIHDPTTKRLRAVIGATHGKPIVIPDARSLFGTDKSVDSAAVLSLLDRHNITDVTARHQQVAALSRAYRQAVSP
ncbi:MAG TPA: FAD binding domain-containing protein [Pseudolabrys sp.]|nr:FAD binding domain-containing protein [Pseudolabrys sp.]